MNRLQNRIYIVVVLDRIRSIYNVGSIFRTSDAFCVQKIYLCEITACPPHPEIHKTALGAENTVLWKYSKFTIHALESLRKEGYILCAVEQTKNSIPMDLWIPEEEKKYALVLGNEVKGVQQQVLDFCDYCIEISQYGTKKSLNVSVAAALSIHYLFNKLNK
ncbi:MAG: TrmH family RNA methyltransferase [Tannerellaceae bacterium]|jgi:tRNA G18 (ribose-2'-O)-methylase SpoU|nr:TrmH family RNA methyltransferase [Tannerellaceae bacterium]